jgi:hypothetical protein
MRMKRVKYTHILNSGTEELLNEMQSAFSAFKKYNCKNISDFVILYLKIDILLLVNSI